MTGLFLVIGAGICGAVFVTALRRAFRRSLDTKDLIHYYKGGRWTRGGGGGQ